MTQNIEPIKSEHCPGGYRELWLVAYPLIITNASHTIMQFVDRKFLSLNSTADVAAAFPGGILCFTLFTFFMITVGFTGTIVAQFHGRGEKAVCARVPWAGFYLSLIAGLICSWLLIAPGDFIIEFARHPGELMAKEKEYFCMLMPGGGFMFMTTAFCAFFSGRGKTWNIAVIHILVALTNILLDYIFIFGKLGFPAMGITGAGLGTTLAAVVGFLISLILFLTQNQQRYPTRKMWLKTSVEDIKRLLNFGIPSGTQVVFSVGSFTFITFLIGRLGEASLAATTIAMSINMLTFMPLLGMSDATAIIVGRHIGKGSIPTSKKATFNALKMSILYTLVMGVIFVIIPRTLFEWFRPEEAGHVIFDEVMKYAWIIMFCVAIDNIFNASRFVFMGALRGAGDTKIPMWLEIACSWGILVPGGYILINVFHLSVVSIWIFIVCYISLLSGVIYLRFRSGAWEKIELIDRNHEDIESQAPLETEIEDYHV